MLNIRTLLSLFIIAFISLVGAPALLGQVNLQRNVMSSTGALANNDSAKLSISYTVGEAFARTAVGNSGTFIVTIGFQQPDDIFVSIGDELEAKLQYQIYPNPTPEEVFVSLTSDQAVDLIIAITDLHGRKTSVPEQSHRISGVMDTRFNLGALADGYYLLSFKNESGEIFKSVKIKKVE